MSDLSSPPTVDTATYLRNTAREMRERADASSLGSRWETAAREDDDSWQVWLVQDAIGGPVAECSLAVDPEGARQRGRWDAEHLASWDPTVARTVADLLTAAASCFDAAGRACVAVGGDVEPAQIMGPLERHALAVARAYNRDVVPTGEA